MAIPADEIAKLPAGARFFRADLHIHSFGGSHDVKDLSMTPSSIVSTAAAERLRLIAVTDHNEIGNVEETIKSASGTPLLVIPGVELTTPQGHLLVYFEAFSSLEKFWGKARPRRPWDPRFALSNIDVGLSPSGRGAKWVRNPGSCGRRRGARGQAPSVRQPQEGYLLRTIVSGFRGQVRDAPMTYAMNDQNPERRALARLRQTSLGFGEEQSGAGDVLRFAHACRAWQKCQGARRLTRVKMDTPSFHGLRLALQDADARVRLEDEIPVSVPYIMGVKIDGGFLDGQSIHFSRNLNCIIGGRGAGKSTAFECVRVIAPGESESKLLDSEIWPDTLHVVWVDEAGQQHTVERRVENKPVNLGDPDGVAQFSIESYGQGETAHTSSKARQNPSSLLEYLDKFVPIGSLRKEDDDIRQRLLENQSSIEKAEIEVNKTPYFRQVLDVTQKQLLALEKAKAKEVVTLERKVAEERSLREQIDRKILGIATAIRAATCPSRLAT